MSYQRPIGSISSIGKMFLNFTHVEFAQNLGLDFKHWLFASHVDYEAPLWTKGKPQLVHGPLMVSGLYMDRSASSEQLVHGPLSERLVHGPLSEWLVYGPLSEQLVHGPLSEQLVHGPLSEQLVHGPLSCTWTAQ